MNSTLFAFRVARPVETSGEDPLDFAYDPDSQTAVWSGDSKAVAALRCTTVSAYGRRSCNAYGSYCSTYGTYVSTNSKRCDS